MIHDCSRLVNLGMVCSLTRFVCLLLFQVINIQGHIIDNNLTEQNGQ